MILNIEICVNVVSWIHIVLINRTSFLNRNDSISNCFTMSVMAKQSEIRIVVYFYYSFILVFSKEKPAIETLVLAFLRHISNHIYANFLSKS